jgi:hypothetical protein
MVTIFLYLDKVKNKNYNMMVSFEDYVLSAWEKRNMGGFVNHSPNFNAGMLHIYHQYDNYDKYDDKYD